MRGLTAGFLYINCIYFYFPYSYSTPSLFELKETWWSRRERFRGNPRFFPRNPFLIVFSRLLRKPVFRPDGKPRPPVRFQTRLNQVTRSEPRDNLGKVRAIRCGFGAGAPGKTDAPCVWFDSEAFAFRSFYSGRGCPCLENRFAEQTGKTVKRGFGVSPKLFSFLSFGYKREDENKKWEIKSKKVNALNIQKACRTAPHPSANADTFPRGGRL